MDVLAFFLLALGLIAFIAVPVIAIWGTFDAFSFPSEVWAAAGHRRSRWAWQAVGALCAPLVPVYSGLYFLRIRPRLVQAHRELQQQLPQAAAVPWDGPVPGGTGGRVRIRVPLRWTALSLSPLLLAGAFNSVMLGARHQYFFALWFVWPLAVGLALSYWFGITLTPVEARVHSFRRRRLAWTDVVAVTQESLLGSRRVVLWTDDGRRTALRAPVMPLPGVGRRRFEREFHTIGQWWLAHRWGQRPDLPS